jgi:drug/metabolite transporter (DMT)-like permease
VGAALVGALVLGETFGGAHLLALSLAIVGLLLATWPDRAATSNLSTEKP